MSFSPTRCAGHPSAHADILHLGARVHNKIPEYKMYSGTDNLKYTRGTTRIDKTIKSYPLSRLTRVHV